MGAQGYFKSIAILAAALTGLVNATPAAADPVPAPPGVVRERIGDCILEAPVSERGRLVALAVRARRLLPRVEAEIGVRAKAPYRIVLIPPDRGGDGAGDLGAAAPEWAAGFLLPESRLGAVRWALADRYPYADPGSVLAHEATHMLLFDAAGANLPRWFGEGVATGIERSWGMRDVLVYSSSLLTGNLPALDDLDAAFDVGDDRARAAYAASFDFLLFTTRTYGHGVVRDIVREAAARPFPEAWRSATGVTLQESEAAWRRGSLLLYRWVPALTGTTALWTAITVLALLAGAKRRARSRRIHEAWEAEERVPAWRDADPPDDVVH